MLTSNKYYIRLYVKIVTNAQNRTLPPDTYKERHHIIPTSMGGLNKKSNIAWLTGREHFICHWLLMKMTTGEDHWKMLNAMRIMRAENKSQTRYNSTITSRVYEKLKTEYAELQRIRGTGSGNSMYGKKQTDEAKAKISAANKGRVQPAEEKERQIAAVTGRKRNPFSDEWIEKMAVKKRGENNPRYGVTLTDDTRKKIGDKIRGRKQTPEEKAIRSAANIGKVREKQACTCCGTLVAVNVINRWHNDNCKSINTE